MTTPEHTTHTPQDHDGQLELFGLHEVQANKEAAKRVEYEILDNPDLRYKYVRYTEGLIARAIAHEDDTLIFLDKSARPVAWLMKSLWPTLGFKDFDEHGQPIPVPMPDIKFVNFDREQWAAVMGRSEGKNGQDITLENVHPDTIDSLTGLFAVKNMDAADYVSADDETMFDNKNIMIVDEVSASGDTLAMAQKLFERAFENAASVDGMHWMPPDKKYDKRSGGMRNADLPVWYDAGTPYGRLVGDRDLYKSGHSPSMRQRRGAQFLSYRLPEIDTAGRQLRREMQQLGRDVAEGVMPVVFDAASRPDTDEFQENFMRHVNNLSIEEFATLRRQAEKEHTSFPMLVAEYKRARDQQ